MPAGSDIETRIKEYYELIKGNGNLKIFKRRDKDHPKEQNPAITVMDQIDLHGKMYSGGWIAELTSH